MTSEANPTNPENAPTNPEAVPMRRFHALGPPELREQLLAMNAASEAVAKAEQKHQAAVDARGRARSRHQRTSDPVDFDAFERARVAADEAENRLAAARAAENDARVALGVLEVASCRETMAALAADQNEALLDIEGAVASMELARTLYFDAIARIGKEVKRYQAAGLELIYANELLGDNLPDPFEGGRFEGKTSKSIERTRSAFRRNAASVGVKASVGKALELDPAKWRALAVIAADPKNHLSRVRTVECKPDVLVRSAFDGKLESIDIDRSRLTEAREVAEERASRWPDEPKSAPWKSGDMGRVY